MISETSQATVLGAAYRLSVSILSGSRLFAEADTCIVARQKSAHLTTVFVDVDPLLLVDNKVSLSFPNLVEFIAPINN